MAKASSVTFKAALGVMVISMVTYTAGATTPALAVLQAKFADYPYWAVTLINSIVSFGTLIGLLVFGAMANKKIKYKTVATFGLLVSGIFGCLPAIFGESLYFILLCRVLAGFGTGFIMSMGATWFLRMVRDKGERDKYLSWNQAFGSGGSMVFTILGGWLSGISATYCFLAYAFVFVAWVIMLICFQEPKTVEEIIMEEGEEAAAELQAGGATKVKLGAHAWIYIILILLYQIFLSQGLSVLAVRMSECGITDGTLVGTLMSVFTLATAVFAVFGGAVSKVLGRLASPIVLLFGALGMLLIMVSGSSAAGYAASMIALGVCACVLAFGSMDIALVTNAAGFAWAATLLQFGGNLGNVLSSFVLGALQTVSFYFPVWFALGGYIVIAVIWAIMNYTSEGWKKAIAEK